MDIVAGGMVEGGRYSAVVLDVDGSTALVSVGAAGVTRAVAATADIVTPATLEIRDDPIGRPGQAVAS